MHNNQSNQAKRILQQAKENVNNQDELGDALQVVKDKHNAYIAEQIRLERERLAQLERERQTNYGLPKSRCYLTGGNYAPYKYCNMGSCAEFTDYALHL